MIHIAHDLDHILGICVLILKSDRYDLVTSRGIVVKWRDPSQYTALKGVVEYYLSPSSRQL